MTKTLFIFGVVLVASLLLAVSVLTNGDQAPKSLTYSDDDAYFLNEWQEAGGGEFVTWGFPASALAKFDITERYMTPELLFSKEFQEALYASREPFSISTDPRSFVPQSDGSQSRLKDSTSFIRENEKRKMAAIFRVRNLDDYRRLY